MGSDLIFISEALFFC